MEIDRDAIIQELDPDNLMNMSHLSDEQLSNIYMDFNSSNPFKQVPKIRAPDKSYTENLLGNTSVNEIPINIVNTTKSMCILGNPLGKNNIKTKEPPVFIKKKKIDANKIVDTNTNRLGDTNSLNKTQILNKINNSTLAIPQTTITNINEIKESKLSLIEKLQAQNDLIEDKKRKERIEKEKELRNRKIDEYQKEHPNFKNLTDSHPNLTNYLQSKSTEPTSNLQPEKLEVKKRPMNIPTDKPTDLIMNDHIELIELLKDSKFKEARMYISNIQNMTHARWLERIEFSGSIPLKELIKNQNKEAYELVCSV